MFSMQVHLWLIQCNKEYYRVYINIFKYRLNVLLTKVVSFYGCKYYHRFIIYESFNTPIKEEQYKEITKEK